MLNQKINIASFDRHVAESLLAMSSSGEKFKKLKCETKLFQYGREEVTFVLEQSGEEPKRFYNFDIAVKHYNEIEIPMDKPTPFPMRENKLVTDDGTPVSETKRGEVSIKGNKYHVLHADYLDGNDIIVKGDLIYHKDLDALTKAMNTIDEDISHGAHVLRPVTH